MHTFKCKTTKAIPKSAFFNSFRCMELTYLHHMTVYICTVLGLGAMFLTGIPTLSGLMLVLSVPVLTRSPSRLQFLLAIATRLPFWLGPADLKRRGNIVWVGPAFRIPLKQSEIYP